MAVDPIARKVLFAGMHRQEAVHPPGFEVDVPMIVEVVAGIEHMLAADGFVAVCA